MDRILISIALGVIFLTVIVDSRNMPKNLPQETLVQLFGEDLGEKLAPVKPGDIAIMVGKSDAEEIPRVILRIDLEGIHLRNYGIITPEMSKRLVKRISLCDPEDFGFRSELFRSHAQEFRRQNAQ